MNSNNNANINNQVISEYLHRFHYLGCQKQKAGVFCAVQQGEDLYSHFRKTRKRKRRKGREEEMAEL